MVFSEHTIGTPRSREARMTLLRRVWIDERGQDLVEYVLLGATVAFAGLTALQLLPGIINLVYSSWDAALQNLATPPPPTK
jgi:Flp pilus assembly pilin Flp